MGLLRSLTLCFRVIEWTLCPATVSRIVPVPLPRQPDFDRLFWLGTVDGINTTKLGYEFLQEVVVQNSSSSTSVGLEPTLWKRFWKAPSLPRVREVAWRVCTGAIPVRMKLCQRGVDVDSCCPLCGVEDESVDHLFLGCNVTRGCWFASNLGIRVDLSLKMADFMSMVTRDMDLEVVANVQRLLCAIWEARIKLIFEDQALSVAAVLDRASDMVPPSSSSFMLAATDGREG